MRLGLVGGGRAAWAYGSAWKRIGWPIAGVWLRPSSSSRLPELLEAPRRPLEELARECELLLIAVSDGAIAEVGGKIPQTEAVVAHASGAVRSLRGGFSLHPLKALPPVGSNSDLQGTLLVFEGEHRKTARLIAAAIGARFAEVAPESKALYHAAAVFGSNYVAALLDIAEETIRKAGVAGAKEDLVVLAQSAILNWSAREGSARFTGPAARGDQQTMDGHRRALAGQPAQILTLYELLAEWIAASVAAQK